MVCQFKMLWNKKLEHFWQLVFENGATLHKESVCCEVEIQTKKSIYVTMYLGILPSFCVYAVIICL